MTSSLLLIIQPPGVLGHSHDLLLSFHQSCLFFFCPSSSYFLFFLKRPVCSYPCILLLQLLAFHYIIVLGSFQFAGIQKFLIKSFSPGTIIFCWLPNLSAFLSNAHISFHFPFFVILFPYKTMRSMKT